MSNLIWISKGDSEYRALSPSRSYYHVISPAAFFVHFVSLFANIKLSDQSIETLLIIHERNFECFFTHDLTITKSNCVKKIFLHSILILNSRKPLEYVKIDRSHSNASFRKKKKKPIQHVSSRKHSRLSSNRQRANIAGDVDVFRYWILILVGLSNCLLSRNTNGLVNFWNIDTTSTHSKSFLPSKKNRKRKEEK